MGLGSQLGMASQTIVVSRAFGLEQAAAWSVGSKAFGLIVPLMGRPLIAALPGLFEISARGDLERLRARFREVVVLVASIGVFLGVSFALCNSLFVHFWVAGKISWSPWNDVLLGTWLFVLSMATTHINLVSVTKQIGGMRYMLIVEGCCFIALALILIPFWGIPGMVIASIATTILFTYQYSLRRSAEYFDCGFMELALGWVRPCLKLALAFGAVAVAIWFADAGLPVLWRLCIHGVLAVTLGGILFLRLGFPPEMIREAATRLPAPAARLLQSLVY